MRQINEIRQTAVDSLNAGSAALDGSLIGPLTASPFSNQEVSIVAVVMSNPRTSGLGNPTDGFPSRIHVYVRDTTANSMGVEGMGIQLVDGAYQTTGLLSAAIGDVIRVVGIPSAFTGSGGASQQLSPTSVEALGSLSDFNLPASLLDPVVITTSDANKSVGADGEVQVNWSNLASLNGQFVRLVGATIQVRDISDRSNWLITSDGGVTVLNFYDMSLRYRNDRDGGYSETEFNVRGNGDDFVPPPPGALVNIQGFVVFQGDDPFGRAVPGGALLSIAPFEDGDLVVTELPPNLSDLELELERFDVDSMTVEVLDPSKLLRERVIVRMRTRLRNRDPNKTGRSFQAGNFPHDDSIRVTFCMDPRFIVNADSSRLSMGATYNDATRTWTISSLAVGDSSVFDLFMEVVVEAVNNLAAKVTGEVTHAIENDLDSNVGDGRGDDYFERFIPGANRNLPCSSPPISIALEVPPSIPEPFALRSNYPNPFLEETIIPFEVPKTAHVTLRVYDLLGRMVAVLFEGPLPIGRHEVKWRPRGLPSGFYLVRLEAAGTVKNRSLMLIR